MDPSATPRPQSSPRIFMSHSHLDDEFGLRLAQDLRRVLGEESAVWYDASGDLHGGDAWWRKIVSEITSRTVFLVILSPESMASSWVNDEIDLAWSQKNARGVLILPILLRPCTIRADLTTRQIISFLPPVPYDSALRSLLVALSLPAAVTPAAVTPPLITPTPVQVQIPVTPPPGTPSPLSPPPATPAPPASAPAPASERVPTPSVPLASAPAPFTLLLLSITGAFQPTRIAVDRDELSIGRDSSNDIVVADDTVSRFHLRLIRQAQITTDSNVWRVLVVPGSGGLSVNGVALAEAPVGAGDQLVFGGTVLRLEPGDARMLASVPRFIVDCEGVHFTASLRSAVVRIGRDPRSSLVIPSPVISAQHATAILATDGTLTLEDAGSRNGLYQNGVRVQRATLRSGEQVTAGTSPHDARAVTLTYRSAGEG